MRSTQTRSMERRQDQKSANSGTSFMDSRSCIKPLCSASRGEVIAHKEDSKPTSKDGPTLTLSAASSQSVREDVSKSRRGRGPRRIGDINENVVALIVAVPTVGISGVAWRRPVVTVVTNIGGRSDVGRWR